MYEVYGLKLADRDGVESTMVLAHTDCGKPVRVSYYMWCIKNADSLVVVDTGMSDEEIRKRTLFNVESPENQLGKIGVDPKDVKTLVVTHLHGDHFSAFDLYPNATFYIQRKDIEFFAGANVKNKALIFAVSNIAEVVRLNYSGRVRPVDCDEEIAPGLSLVLVGAHTPGSQIVAVETSKGTAVICGDLVDLYRNIEENIHGGLTFDVLQCYTAFEKVKRLASSPDLIIPGHDPLIMERFPKVADGVIRIGKVSD
jgi:glyoxylase-like metal-dependent hydrolase (beta-lactamase superfamily II)